MQTLSGDACFHDISLKHSRFTKIAGPFLIFTHSGRSEAIGIAYRPPCSLYSARISVDAQTHRDRPSTVTLAVLAHRAWLQWSHEDIEIALKCGYHRGNRVQEGEQKEPGLKRKG